MMVNMPEILIVLLFIAVILGVVFLPFLRQKHLTKPSAKYAASNSRDEANIALYQEHKAELEQDLADGRVDQENYQYLLAELDKSLLHDMNANKKVHDGEALIKQPVSLFWPVVLSLFVVAFSVVVYLQTGAYQQLTQEKPKSKQEQAHQQLSAEQQLILKVQQLGELSKKEPDNADNWYNLGQALIGVDEFSAALSAFDQVIRIEGTQADIVGAKAQAAYYLNQQQITNDVQVLIEQALSLDPKESSTNILLGMHHFTQQNYQQAIDYWQLVIDSKYNNVNVPALQGALDEAKKRLALTGSQTSSVQTQATQQQPEQTNDLAPKLTISLSLADHVQNQLAQQGEKVVFVYAIPVNGQRMPLAALKLRSFDLPATITLSNDNAMSPQANLSSTEQVHIMAVISQSGSVGIKPGDYQGKVSNVSVASKEPIKLIIDDLIQ